jgi:hypothetical protein
MCSLAVILEFLLLIQQHLSSESKSPQPRQPQTKLVLYSPPNQNDREFY